MYWEVLAIAEHWQLMPSKVMEIKEDSPMDYIAMAGYIHARWEQEHNNYDVRKPTEVSHLPI